MKMIKTTSLARNVALTLALSAALAATPAFADETSCSPFTPLIKGQEDLVYVWTLGVKGIGDGSDKLVTVDVNPKSKTYGKVIHKLSLGGRGEVHHVGLSDDRRFLWGGALDSNKIFVFDIGTNPAKPKLTKTITDFVEKTGFVGPHSFIAMPGRMLITPLSNKKDHGGETGVVVYNNKGEYVSHEQMPKTNGGDGYGYDVGINPQKNVFLTSSFTGWNNYMMDLGKMVKDPEAMKRFGNTSVMWDMKTMKPLKVFQTPGAPLEVRWSWNKGDNWAVTTTALTSKIWVYKQDAKGEWQARDVATIGDPAKIPLPVDISITADAKGMWINTFMDGTARYWDKKAKDDEQYLKLYNWDGKDLKLAFEIDFYKEKLGRAHHMKFQARDLSTLQPLDVAQNLPALLARKQ